MATGVLPGTTIIDIHAKFPLPQSLVYFKESKNQTLDKEKTVQENCIILSNTDFALILHWIPVTSRNSHGRAAEVRCLPDDRPDSGPPALSYSTGNAKRSCNPKQHLCQPSPCLTSHSQAQTVPHFLIFGYILSPLEQGQSSSKE